jgi:hypothetical protein
MSAGLPGGPRTGLHDGTAAADNIADLCTIIGSNLYLRKKKPIIEF